MFSIGKYLKTFNRSQVTLGITCVVIECSYVLCKLFWFPFFQFLFNFLFLYTLVKIKYSNHTKIIYKILLLSSLEYTIFITIILLIYYFMCIFFNKKKCVISAVLHMDVSRVKRPNNHLHLIIAVIVRG